MFINATVSDNKVQDVNGLTPLEKALVLSYLQGCVYSWCNNQGGKWFKAQFFLGGQNYYWQGTPLYCLYSKRYREYNKDSAKACEQAARDAGHLLKDLLLNDKRHFHTNSENGYRWYSWDEANDEDILDKHIMFHSYITNAKDELEPTADSFID